MNEERSKILEMLAQGQISVDDASRLLDAVDDQSATKKPSPKFLRVVIDDKDDKVNIRVPLQLIRAGVNLASLMPDKISPQVNVKLKEKGLNLDFSNIKGDQIEELVQCLEDLAVDVNEKDGAIVRIFCE